MARKFQLYRGLEVNLPALDDGQIAFTRDTKKLFVGSADGNIEYVKKSDHDAHLADFAAKQFGGRPYTSISPKTYYIDEVNGSDEFDGQTTETAFKSWEKVLSQLPYFFYHPITVYVIGNYTNSIVVSHCYGEGASTLTIRGVTETQGNHVVNAITVNSCSNTIIEYLKINGQIRIDKSIYAAVQRCLPRGTNASINCVASRVNITNCDFGTDIVNVAIQGIISSHIYSSNNIGNALGYGLFAAHNSTIGKSGTQPTGSSANERTEGGGVIR